MHELLPFSNYVKTLTSKVYYCGFSPHKPPKVLFLSWRGDDDTETATFLFYRKRRQIRVL